MEVKFATKPVLAREMITRALDAGVRAGRGRRHEVYGADLDLRREFGDREVAYAPTPATPP